MIVMVEQQDVDELARQLLDDLEVDWVSIPRMPWFAARILGPRDNPGAARELITSTLLDLVGHPEAKVVDADMSHEFTSRDELARHLDEQWADTGEPIENEIGWLVERDFELRQPSVDPD